MALTCGLSLDEAMDEAPGFVLDLYHRYCEIHGLAREEDD
jgi:hypothetical protein